MAENGTNSGPLGKPKTGGQGLLDPSEPRDLNLIEAARPRATNEQRRNLGKLWFEENQLHSQIERKDWSWNDKKQRTRVYVGEMVDKDGNIWVPDEWLDLVHRHFADLYKAPEVKILAEQREVASLSYVAVRSGGRARDRKARAGLEIAMELAERKCKPDEYDEQLTAQCERILHPVSLRQGKRHGCGQGPGQKTKECDETRWRPCRIGWGFVVVRTARRPPDTMLPQEDEDGMEVSGTDQDTCENEWDQGETANIYVYVYIYVWRADGHAQTLSFMQNGVWLTVRGPVSSDTPTIKTNVPEGVKVRFIGHASDQNQRLRGGRDKKARGRGSNFRASRIVLMKHVHQLMR